MDPSVFYSPDYVYDLDGHSWAPRKFRLTAERMEGFSRVDAGLACDADLALAHAPEWVAKMSEGRLTLEDEVLLELPWSPAMAKAQRAHAAGTLAACREALAKGVGLHAGGGAHHAFADRGEGFCAFNDLAIALLKLREEGALARAAVVDLDAHQGNGTASILAGIQGLATFSMHEDDIYPFDRKRERVASTLDIPLPRGTSDAKYLKLLTGSLDGFLDEHRPQLVLYQAGVDSWEGDLLGRLKLTRGGIAERDRRLFEECFMRGIPVAVTLGGGYAARIEDTAALHARTLTLAAQCRRRMWRG